MIFTPRKCETFSWGPIESFPHPEAETKGALNGHRKDEQKLRERILSNWHLSKPALEKMRNEKYRTKVRSREALVDV